MPPLVPSPSCTPKTYCQSESSTTDCPSPDLVGQHYSIGSIYDLGLSCSMASPYDTGASSLSRLDHQHFQPEWKWSSAVALHSSLPMSRESASSNTHAEYDPSTSYHDTFSHYSYPTGPLPVSRSPASSSRSKVTTTYPPIGGGSSLTPPRQPQRDHATHGYAHAVEGSQYPSPSVAHALYPPTMNDPSISSRISHLAGPPSSSGVLDDSRPDWHKTDRYVTDSGHLQQYPELGSHSLGLLPMAHDAQVGGGTRPRRAPRKLTTKEDANFVCPVEGCGKLFSRSYNYKAHMETHREKRDYPFPCQVSDCTKKFVRKTDLRRHHQSVHVKERNYRCEFCGRCFSRRDTLGR